MYKKESNTTKETRALNTNSKNFEWVHKKAINNPMLDQTCFNT